jgi:hypothetical protein
LIKVSSKAWSACWPRTMRRLSRDTPSNPPAIRSSLSVSSGRPLSSLWIAARMNALGLVNPRALTASSIRSRFPTQSHGDSGSARCSRILSHNCSLNY